MADTMSVMLFLKEDVRIYKFFTIFKKNVGCRG